MFQEQRKGFKEVYTKEIFQKITEQGRIYTHQVISAWQRAFNLTHGLGINVYSRDQIDVLSAIHAVTIESFSYSNADLASS